MVTNAVSNDGRPARFAVDPGHSGAATSAVVRVRPTRLRAGPLAPARLADQPRPGLMDLCKLVHSALEIGRAVEDAPAARRRELGQDWWSSSAT